MMLLQQTVEAAERRLADADAGTVDMFRVDSPTKADR